MIPFTSPLLIAGFTMPTQGTGKRAHIVADTLLLTQMFPRLPALATFVAGTDFVYKGNRLQG